MATGIVKFFNFQAGFGFIRPDTIGLDDVFLHISALEAAGITDLKDDQAIEYTLSILDRRGKQSAVDIFLIDDY